MSELDDAIGWAESQMKHWQHMDSLVQHGTKAKHLRTLISAAQPAQTEPVALLKAVQFYARHEHWMSLSADADGSNRLLIANGDTESVEGWAVAEAALAAPAAQPAQIPKWQVRCGQCHAAIELGTTHTCAGLTGAAVLPVQNAVQMTTSLAAPPAALPEPETPQQWAERFGKILASTPSDYAKDQPLDIRLARAAALPEGDEKLIAEITTMLQSTGYPGWQEIGDVLRRCRTRLSSPSSTAQPWKCGYDGCDLTVPHGHAQGDAT